jgi:DNA-binding winged helix-turn-helix (wHTH) protein/tetratricopeptide (TPR) repeat protein
MSATPVRYRFGLFTLDPANGRLARQGEPVRVQEQPLQVLAALLERPGEIVSRDDLRRRLWPGDTFVEFDKSLGVALAKVRAALGDDSANPRFVETVPRRGYRFIAPVTIEGEETNTVAEPAPAPPAPVRAVDGPARRPATWARALVAAVAIAALIGAVLAYRRAQSAPARHAPLVVVLAQFTNTTGDQAFDGSLRRAAGVALRQSPFLNVPADDRLADSVQDLGRAPAAVLSPALARDVCQHIHGTAVIDGSVARDEGRYVVVVSASRCGDGAPLARERQTAASKDGVLEALGHALERIRGTLGESRDSLTSFDVPVQVATTESVDALRAFELGMELRLRGDNERAIPALQSAIALDPQFALAFAQLGSAYSNMGDTTRGGGYLRKAFELRERATEPERLVITGRYFDIVTGEREKAVETYRLWSRMYPDEWLAFNALANDGNQMGRYELARSAAARAVELEPRELFGQINLMTALAALGRFDEAKTAAARILERNPKNSIAHVVRYAIADYTGDEAARRSEVAWSGANPGDSGVIYAEGESLARRGRYAEAARQFQQVVRIDRAAQKDASAANALCVLAGFEALAGLNQSARDAVDQAVPLGLSATSGGLTAVVYALTGHAREAQASLDAYDRDLPLAMVNIGIYAPMARLALALEHQPTADDVTRLMAPAVPYELGQEADLIPAFLRGRGYLAANAPQLAAAEFQKVIDHPGVDPVSPLYPLALVGLGRADAAVGRVAEAQKAYQTFLDLWKDADRDVPILRAAIREYATIR